MRIKVACVDAYTHAMAARHFILELGDREPHSSVDCGCVRHGICSSFGDLLVLTTAKKNKLAPKALPGVGGSRRTRPLTGRVQHNGTRQLARASAAWRQTAAALRPLLSLRPQESRGRCANS